MAKKVIVGGRIESKEVGGIVTGAAEILDDSKGKKQSVINQETDAELARLDQSKQDNLTFDNTPTEGSDNPVKSGGVYAAQQAILLAIAAINELIPSAASVLNQLADKAFVNSSISTNTATFRGTSAAGLNEQQFLAWANGLEHDLNDYVFWQTSDAAGNTLFKRYKWNGTEWAYEYTLNNSTFTAEQWEAIQSGITALLVMKLRALPTAQELIQSFDGKQDVLTFDDVPTLGSNNPVKSSGIYNVIKAITDLIPAEATAQNQLADKADVAAKIVAAIPSWKGQYDALTDLQAVTGAKAGDMGCVKTTDSDGHAVLTFYQYSAQGAWVVYYVLRHYAQNKPATTGTTGDYPYNGMGRIELQKNIVNGVNTLTQAMLTQQNTIYVIKYDYVLGANITVPTNCVLEFDGGSISGAHTLTGNNTIIIAPQDAKIFHTINIGGTWNVPTVYVDWFELSETTGANNTPNIQNALALTDDNVQNTVVFPKKTLYFNEDIDHHSTPQKLYTFRIKSNTDIILNSDMVLNTNDVIECTVFYIQEAINISISGCGGITGDLFTHTGSGHGYGHGIAIRGSKNITVKDIYINQCWGDGIDVDSFYPYDPRQYYDPSYPGYIDDPTKYPASNDDFTYHSLHILIDNVKLDNNRRQGISFEGVAYSEIKNCLITNTGQFLSGDDSMGGIDVEPWVRNEGNRGINIHDNSFYNNYKKDIVLACIGGDGTGWGSYITLRNNYNKEEGFVKTSMCCLDNLTVTDSNINNGEFYKIHDVVFENCKINNVGRIESNTGTADNNYNIYFKNCKFVKSSDDSTPFIERVSYNRGLKAVFTNCLFETGGNCPIIGLSAYSEISLYDCVVNAAGILTIGGVKNIVNSNITCGIMILSFNQVNGDYIIKGNFIKSISTSYYTLVRINGTEALPATISIYFEDNYIQKAMRNMQVIGYDDPGEATKFADANFYVVGNKGLNNPRFGTFAPTNIKRYNNACLGQIDTDPYTGETAYPDNSVPKIYNGTAWVDATGTPV